MPIRTQAKRDRDPSYKRSPRILGQWAEGVVRGLVQHACTAPGQKGDAVSPNRAQAYRRVIHTLDDLGPSKLLAEEQERIREAMDTLIFCSSLSDDLGARNALEDAGSLCRSLVESGRWEEITAMRLLDDLYGCGPELEPVVEVA